MCHNGCEMWKRVLNPKPELHNVIPPVSEAIVVQASEPKLEKLEVGSLGYIGIGLRVFGV